MNTIEQIKSFINSPADPAKRVKAVFYGRVFTDNEGQAESCDNQLSMCEQYITHHPNVELLDRLVDEGISGKNASTRPDFLQLLKYIESEEIDLIITKSQSRLERSTEVSSMLRRVCKHHKVAILTLETGEILDFSNRQTAMLYSFKSIINEDYVIQQSINGHEVQALRCALKKLSAKDCCFGFRWDRNTKEISINSEEAEVINEIFSAYLYEHKMPVDIAYDLNARGIPNRFSKSSFTSGTINKIIMNSKYAGRFYINQRTTELGIGTDEHSRRIERPKEEWVLVERPDLAIVSPEVFDMAQKLRGTRQHKYDFGGKEVARQRFEDNHLFASKLKCSCCGKPLRYKLTGRAGVTPYYTVNSHKGCSNKSNYRIFEETASELFQASVKAMLESQNEAISRVEKLLYANISKVESGGDLKRLERDIKALEKEIDKYSLPLTDPDVLANTLLKQSFLGKIKAAQDKLFFLEAKRAELLSLSDFSNADQQVAALKKALSQFKEVKSVTRDRVLRNLKEMSLNSDGSVSIVLTPGLSFSGDVDKCEQRGALDFALVNKDRFLVCELTYLDIPIEVFISLI